MNRLAALAASLLAVAACGSDRTSAPQPGAPTRVDVTVAPSATGAAGSSGGTFTVKVFDAKGLAVPGVAVSFVATGSASVVPATATTDVSGLASTQVTLGTSAGAASVMATAPGVAAAASSPITVIAGPTTRIVVAPKTLRFFAIGDTARIAATAQDQYGNSPPSGSISHSVVDGTLVSVDQAGLVRVLRLNGTTFVISSSSGRADTTIVTVFPAGASICTGLATSRPMAAGDVQTFSGAQYGCLQGSAAGAEYVMVAFNGSTDQNNSLTASVMGNGLAAPPTTFTAPTGSGAVAIRSASGFGATPAPRLDEGFHQRLLAQANAQFRGSFGRARSARWLAPSRSITPSGLGQSPSYAAIPATAKVGDVITLNVSGSICTAPVNHPLKVAAIGTRSIVLADTLNPTGGFTDADFQRFAARFDTLVYPLDVGAFGAPSDIDNNGRVAIIFTLTVNELTPAKANYYVGGFFNPRDLFPKVGGTTADNCPGSNEGEMFYMLVPDPTGKINGNVRATDFVDSLTTGVLAHEFQHLINGSRRMYVNTASQDFEEIWLNEGLSHIAEELLYYRESGLTPRMNLNDSTIRIINRPTYRFWKSDAASNFSRFLEYLRSPGLNSPYANDDALATRGATWSFLRYAADRLGTTDGTIWQRFNNVTVTGQATLLSAFGTDPIPLIRDWAVANFLDDFGSNTDARFMHKSWNFRDIFTTTFTNIPTYPLLVNRLADNSPANLSIRGGSATYLRIAIGPGKEGLFTFASGGGLPSAPLQFVVVRTK